MNIFDYKCTNKFNKECKKEYHTYIYIILYTVYIRARKNSMTIERWEKFYYHHGISLRAYILCLC
jgi:hypothetical protein